MKKKTTAIKTLVKKSTMNKPPYNPSNKKTTMKKSPAKTPTAKKRIADDIEALDNFE